MRLQVGTGPAPPDRFLHTDLPGWGPDISEEGARGCLPPLAGAGQVPFGRPRSYSRSLAERAQAWRGRGGKAVRRFAVELCVPPATTASPRAVETQLPSRCPSRRPWRAPGSAPLRQMRTRRQVLPRSQFSVLESRWRSGSWGPRPQRGEGGEGKLRRRSNYSIPLNT